MSPDTRKILVLSKTEHQDLESYCKLNNLDVDVVLKDSYLQGFRIEKYGLLGNPGAVHEKQVLKEVIVEKRVEVPVEVIVEKPVIEYVEVEKEIIKEVPREVLVEKIVEVVKEVPVEKVVEKTVEIVKEIPVDRVVIQEVIKEVPVEKFITKTEYVTDESKVLELVQELERLRALPPTTLEKEVIKEVPVPYEVVREVEVIKEVMVEVPVEVVKEVLVEKKTSEDTQRLQETINKLRQQTIDKDVKIKQLEEEIVSLKSLLQPQKAVYLRGSNLDDKLYR
jgi:hypothetical protein